MRRRRSIVLSALALATCLAAAACKAVMHFLEEPDGRRELLFDGELERPSPVLP